MEKLCAKVPISNKRRRISGGLEQVYYVGELIAATAVVASLLYIARQARQNTAMMQVNAAPIQTSILENVQRRL